MMTHHVILTVTIMVSITGFCQAGMLDWKCFGETMDCKSKMENWQPFESCERYIACHHFGNSNSKALRSPPTNPHATCIFRCVYAAIGCERGLPSRTASTASSAENNARYLCCKTAFDCMEACHPLESQGGGYYKKRTQLHHKRTQLHHKH